MIKIDLEKSIVTVSTKEGENTHSISSPEGFAVITEAWLRSGWDTKYVYGFTWFGRPIIQLPEDLLRIQEAIYRVKPDVIIETGVAHGGGQVFFASLCKAMGKGRVIGIDIEIRSHNRAALDAHELRPLMTLIEGSSIDAAIVETVKGHIKPGDTVFIVLDSNHTKDHVLGELEAYAPMVTLGSYIIAADGIMESVVGAPRTKPDWIWNNPKAAVKEFLSHHPEFVLSGPPQPFNEGSIGPSTVTYWPGGYLKRVR